jgi:glycosyltransferase involved in cell wall biosynthesis
MSIDRLEGLHILVISPQPWAGLHMSKHHVSQGLVARGNKVVFWERSLPEDTEVRIAGEGDLRIARTPHWFKGVNRLPAFVNRWYYGRLIRSIERAAGVRFDIIWCFDTSRMQWFPNGDRYRLLHLVDYDILYQGHGLMRSADLIVTTADIINTRVLEIAPHASVHKVGHALDRRWVRNNEGLAQRTSSAPRLVVYAGQFYHTYIDWGALLSVAQEHPDLKFRYIGNLDPDFPDAAFQRLRTEPNVEFTGLKTKDELVPMVREADILIFSFMTDNRLLERANPHKVLEYLSTGNVIMGSWTLEYAPHQHLLMMAPDRSGFVPTFRRTVERFAELNTPERRAERIAFAQERTTDRLLERVAGLIAQHGRPTGPTTTLPV